MLAQGDPGNDIPEGTANAMPYAIGLFHLVRNNSYNINIFFSFVYTDRFILFMSKLVNGNLPPERHS